MNQKKTQLSMLSVLLLLACQTTPPLPFAPIEQQAAESTILSESHSQPTKPQIPSEPQEISSEPQAIVELESTVEPPETGCYGTLELNEKSAHNQGFWAPVPSSSVLRFITRFTNCSFEIADIQKNTYYLKTPTGKQSFHTFDRAKHIFAPAYPSGAAQPQWLKEFYEKKAIYDVVEVLQSYCKFYGDTRSTSFEVFAETELKSGEVIIGKPLRIELTPLHIDLCTNPIWFAPMFQLD